MKCASSALLDFGGEVWMRSVSSVAHCYLRVKVTVLAACRKPASSTSEAQETRVERGLEPAHCLGPRWDRWRFPE
jgi:hypothetical protein